MKEFKIPISPCPACNEPLDTASELFRSGTSPTPNCSLSVCAHCGIVSMFGDGLVLRALTEQEVVRVMEDKVLLESLKNIRVPEAKTSIH